MTAALRNEEASVLAALRDGGHAALRHMSDGRATMDEADYLYASGRDMLHSAQALAERNRQQGERRFVSTTYFLMGFVVELFLKSFLARRGLDKAALKGIGHDLGRARDVAVAYGFAFPELGQLDVLVDSLSDAHRSLSFRYMVPGTRITVPQPPEACLALLDRLDDEIRREVNVLAAWAELPMPGEAP